MKNKKQLLSFPDLSNESLCCLSLDVSQVSTPRPKSRVSFLLLFHFVAAGGVTAQLACSHVLEVNNGKTHDHRGCSCQTLLKAQCVQLLHS